MSKVGCHPQVFELAGKAAENPLPDLGQDGRAADPGLFPAGVRVYNLLALAAGPFGPALMMFSLRQMRRETAASLRAPLFGIVSSTLLTFVFILVTGVPLNAFVAGPLFGLGVIIGLVEGQFTRLYYRDNLLLLKRSAIYFVLWGLAYLLTVLLAQTGSAALTAGGILSMLLALGIALGSNLNLLFRQTVMRPAASVASANDSSSRGERPSDLPGSGAPSKPALYKPTDLPG